MAVQIAFETHSWSEDNDRGIATGWLPGRLSARGRELAAELGVRRRDDNLDAVFSSDLRRAVETTEIAFNGTNVPVLLDWRLRECDYGDLNGRPSHEVLAERAHRINTPYPKGESWEAAIQRVAPVLSDLLTRWDGGRVLLVGHVATRWALDTYINGADLESLVRADFGWREGWEYQWAG